MSTKDKRDFKIRNNPHDVDFGDIGPWLNGYGFSLHRVRGSHHIFIHPEGELLNFQPDKNGKAKAYQVKHRASNSGQGFFPVFRPPGPRLKPCRGDVDLDFSHLHVGPKTGYEFLAIRAVFGRPRVWNGLDLSPKQQEELVNLLLRSHYRAEFEEQASPEAKVDRPDREHAKEIRTATTHIMPKPGFCTGKQVVTHLRIAASEIYHLVKHNTLNIL